MEPLSDRLSYDVMSRASARTASAIWRSANSEKIKEYAVKWEAKWKSAYDRGEAKVKTCKKCGALFAERHCNACEKERGAKRRIEQPLAIKAAQAKHYAANAKSVAAKHAEWRATNAEKWKEYQKQYDAEHQEEARIKAHNRRAKKRNNGGVLSKGLSDKLFKLQKGMCPCCKQALGDDYHLDHKMPIVLGGANEDWNMQLLRRLCNGQKYTKHPVDFMQSRGFLL